ncbi:CpaF family protein [Alphaproteobacteria bacterium]|jgi:pilus assembly protein CpaF|nr:CpaF family protein [Alphaproteobacteria bacterium]|tara:strand:+ start:5948 stop:7420 length:1473 start_codon:yes stop_codon:yes gene_type:complete
MKPFGKKTALDDVSLQEKVTGPSSVILNEEDINKIASLKDLNKNVKRETKPSDNSSENNTDLNGLLLDTKLQETKILIFNDLIDAVELSQLTNMVDEEVRDEISDVVSEIIVMRQLILSASEQRQVIESICDDVLGLGPLEPLMNQDDISDIMVNHSGKIYIERNGKIELTEITFRDNAQLMNICQRIVTAVGRRVDEASPICDARLMDGSRVNVIARPLAIDGAALTIRKFQKQKLTLDDLVSYGSVSKQCAQLLEVIGACRLNILVSGGTGSGKTTLLNCLTNYIDTGERVITCEDAAELQLKNPHVVRLETRPPNIEGSGEISMRDLVKNCLRMRPDRIIVGEVRGSEAFDLLQAMNTGHDGSMGTVHANNPRESISRIENMIAMGGFNLPSRILREQISSAVNIIVQATRLRDGSRKITHVTEVIGMEEDIITLQDLFTFEIEREDENGKLIGKHVYSGLRPSFWDKARYFGLESKLNNAINISQN